MSAGAESERCGQLHASPLAWFLAALIAVSAAAALPLGEWPPAPWSFFGLVPFVFGFALALAAVAFAGGYSQS